MFEKRKLLIATKHEKEKVIAKFDDFSSSVNPYMYHCHFSNHEDEGMMGQFLVQ